MARRRRYLVAYDIREDKRLRRVHKTMKGYGWSLQYSVFICDLDTMELLAMRSDLGRHHPPCARLHCYRRPWRPGRARQ